MKNVFFVIAIFYTINLNSQTDLNYYFGNTNNFNESIPKPSEVIIETYKEESSSMVDGDGIDDDLLHKAIEIIIMSKQGSISLLQRRLSVGYSRAARLIDEMERLKIVGPFTGSKAREVLVDESYLKTINED